MSHSGKSPTVLERAVAEESRRAVREWFARREFIRNAIPVEEAKRDLLASGFSERTANWMLGLADGPAR